MISPGTGLTWEERKLILDKYLIKDVKQNDLVKLEDFL
jgi:hypothetical protein